MAQVNLSTEKKIMDFEKRLVVAKGEGEGVEWAGSLGLMPTIASGVHKQWDTAA